MTFRKIRSSKFSLFFSLRFLCTVRLTRGSEREHVFFYVAGVNWTIHLTCHRSQSLLSSCTQSWPNFFDTWQKPAVALRFPGPRWGVWGSSCVVCWEVTGETGGTTLPAYLRFNTHSPDGGGQPVCLEEFTLLNTHPCPYLLLISTRSRCRGCRRYLSSCS